MKIMKIQLLLSPILFFAFNFFLNGTVCEDIIFANFEEGKRVALFGTIHDEKGEEEFSAIYQNLVDAKEPLLLLNESDIFIDYHRILSGEYKVLKAIAKLPFLRKRIIRTYREQDIILYRIALLDFYNFLPQHITFKAIDHRLYSWYMHSDFDIVNRDFLTEFLAEQPYNWRNSVTPEISNVIAQEVEFFLVDLFRCLYACLKEELFESAPFELNELENPSLTTLLLLLKFEIEILKKLTIHEKIKDLFWRELSKLEENYLSFQTYCRKNFTKEELRIPFAYYVGTIFREQKNDKINVLSNIYSTYGLVTWYTILDLVAINEIYTTSHKKIAVFTGAAHTRNLAIWLQKLGWSIVHKTERDYKNGVPSSDFDFLK